MGALEEPKAAVFERFLVLVAWAERLALEDSKPDFSFSFWTKPFVTVTETRLLALVCSYDSIAMKRKLKELPFRYWWSSHDDDLIEDPHSDTRHHVTRRRPL